MSFSKTSLEGVLIFEPRVFKDDRGYFFESYNQNLFKENGINCNFVQDNQSFSTFGTVRGIHLQRGEHAQAKLVRVTKGRVLDVAVDLRPESKDFGKWIAVELSAENNRQLFVPRGFGHGFSVLSEEAIFQYKVDNFYNKESESGVIYNDAELSIDWGLKPSEILTSSKDHELPSLSDFRKLV